MEFILIPCLPVFPWDPNSLPSFVEQKEKTQSGLVLPRFFVFFLIPQQPHCCLLVKALGLKRDHLLGSI